MLVEGFWTSVVASLKNLSVSLDKSQQASPPCSSSAPDEGLCTQLLCVPVIYIFDSSLILEQARKHRIRESARSSIDTVHFKLQKPISKDESSKKIKKNSSRKRWWRNALLFFKRIPTSKSNNEKISDRRPTFGGSISGPVYITESSRSGSNIPYRTTSRPSSGPLAGTLTPSRKGDLEIPYISLREFNMDQRQHKISTSSAMPIYLVT